MSRRRTNPTPPRVARGIAPRPAAVPAAAAGPARHLLALAGVALLAAALYWPSLDGAFVYDDPNAVSQSTLIRSLTPVGKFILLSTRPLTDYTYAVNYAIGGLETRSFHVTGVLLHIGTACALYVLAWLTLALPALAGRYGAARWSIAWAAALLFTVHPLASETVAYISSRSEALAGLWYLLAVVAYVRAATAARRRRWWAAAVGLSTFLGVLSKETAFTLPVVLALFDWLLIARRDWRRVHWRLIAVPTTLLALIGLAFLTRATRGTMTLGDYAATAGFNFDRWGPLDYLATQFGAVVHYLRLTVLPIGQTFDYDWPLASLSAPLAVLVPLLLLLGLVGIAWRVRETQPLTTFTVAWVLLILAPTSSLMPIADLVVERRMYLPLAFISLLAAAWLHDGCAALPAEWKRRGVWLPYAGAVAALVAFFSPFTWQRAALWGDAIALHRDGVAKAPDNPRMRLNLGVTYLNNGDPEGAYVTLVEAKQLYDRGESVHAFPRIGAFIHYNLGAVLFARKQYDEAEAQLERSLELGGHYLALRPMAKMLLSRISAQRDDWPQAIERLEEALKYQDNPDWRVDLAQMKVRAGTPIGARMILESTLQQFPGNARARDMLERMDAEAKAQAKPRPAGRKAAVGQ